MRGDAPWSFESSIAVWGPCSAAWVPVLALSHTLPPRSNTQDSQETSTRILLHLLQIRDVGDHSLNIISHNLRCLRNLTSHETHLVHVACVVESENALITCPPFFEAVHTADKAGQAWKVHQQKGLSHPSSIELPSLRCSIQAAFRSSKKMQLLTKEWNVVELNKNHYLMSVREIIFYFLQKPETQSLGIVRLCYNWWTFVFFHFEEKGMPCVYQCRCIRRHSRNASDFFAKKN